MINFMIPYESRDNEIWLPITQYNLKSYYLVSDYGRIFSMYTKKIISPFFSRDGYYVAKLTRNDGTLIGVGVHRLELITFCHINNHEDYSVNHKDGDKTNNYLYNLEWTTPSENDIHAVHTGLWDIQKGEDSPNAKITNNDVENLCILLDSGIGVIDAINQLAINNKASYCVFDNINLGLSWINISKKYNFTRRLFNQFSESELAYISERIFYDMCANRTIFNDLCKIRGVVPNKYTIRKGINGISKLRYDLEISNIPYKPAVVFID